ncbi:pyridoxal phosphate-dependent aminotransferase [Solibaculum mannosilyticum]|uniref:pyridoxal phosphate-dependent aminotransferase n=1 Tax=Solibaculum mannosilyticum TaxID=2780922 RepID=UPI0007A8F1DC|nr:Histidinol-phosphate aminotransferase 2 [Eubacteriaceae bacterium CHKCI005]
MAYQLAAKVRDLVPYDPIEGQYRIRLDANESFLLPPPWLQQEMEDGIRKAMCNRYPDPKAETVCRLFARYYGIKEELVTAGNGSDELIMLIAASFLEKGDKVVTVMPDFSMYAFYSSLSEVEVVEAPKREDLTIDVDELIQTVQRTGARALIFSNPCNPTSLGVEAQEVRRLIRSVQCLVVLDEAYMDFWDQSLLDEVEQYDNLLILRTCSKAFGMAALRLGFAVANPVLTRALHAVKSPYNVNSLTQGAGAAVLSHPDYLRECVGNILASRDDLYQKLKPMVDGWQNAGMAIPCTNFVHIRTPHARHLFEGLKEEGIAVRLIAGGLRICAGTPEENREVARVLKKLGGGIVV